MALHSDVAASEPVQISTAYDAQGPASTIGLTPVDAVRKNASFGGTAVERSSTAAVPFDYSSLIVVGFGVIGLFWMRRQTHSL